MQVVSTDKEVWRLIDEKISSSTMSANLKGIYNIQRLHGIAVGDAWESTLKTYLEMLTRCIDDMEGES